ncbi:LacI family DNA-binding transcriptional regulator [Arcticibacterium luteifluviistationis]|uniref:LacI family transcriptional regulator n=1 Tax=Arcticibacterium luteifluviistationis TaxID=1784714 RepID=A0A2Z4GEY3_9BACT|nr:LacI family DNA-binding transcriptional regulator [Arcticibacterium luteifluviistationis]AWV99595.1 LacI family transcriptional regulator [Arcticibacterium luteifluviistationis]
MARAVVSKKKSIGDLSRELKISTTTISYVLNGKGREKRISQKVIDRIEKYIEEVGYSPDFIGRSLRTGKSMTLGLVVGDLRNPFFSEISSEIERLAAKSGYSLIVTSSNDEPEKALRAVRLLSDRKVDGMAVAVTEGLEREISSLIETKVPVVLYDRYLEGLSSSNVVVNNRESTFGATSHLYQNGYRNIAYVTFDLNQTSRLDRLKGYEAFVAENDLKSIVFKMADNIDYTQSANEILAFINENPEIDAVIFSTNLITLSGLGAINKLDRKIGLISFDDHVLYEVFTPSITAISQPLKLIAEKIMENLLKMITNDEPFVMDTIVLPTVLKVRESSQQ